MAPQNPRDDLNSPKDPFQLGLGLYGRITHGRGVLKTSILKITFWELVQLGFAYLDTISSALGVDSVGLQTR